MNKGRIFPLLNVANKNKQEGERSIWSFEYSTELKLKSISPPQRWYAHY